MPFATVVTAVSAQSGPDYGAGHVIPINFDATYHTFVCHGPPVPVVNPWPVAIPSGRRVMIEGVENDPGLFIITHVGFK